MHFLITRPKIQAGVLQTELQKMGHKLTLAPLLEIHFEKPVLDLKTIQSIVVTSQNAVQALLAHPNSKEILKLPLVVVGNGTAAEARKAGFQIMIEGDAGGAELAERIKVFMDPGKGALLHASGDIMAFDLEKALRPSGFDVHRKIVYQTTTAKNLPQAAAIALQNRNLDGILLMSPRTSQVWVDLIFASDLTEETRNITHICLSDAVAKPLQKLENVKIKVALKPNLKEFLAAIGVLSSS